MTEHIIVLQLLDISVLALLILTAVALVISRQLMVSNILLAIFSLLMALMYLIMGAPDVAITEAAIGAGISTMLLIGAILLVGEQEAPAPRPVLPLLVMGTTGAALIYATLGLPAFGDPEAPANAHLGQYYITRTEGMADIPNVVTAILASYRGFDTMGEVFVVFTAVIAVAMLLQSPAKKEND